MIANSQLGQVSYYPSSGYLRTGAESSVPVDPALQADPTALAPAGTDSFNSSASNLAPTTAPAEEPQKKKGINYLAWGALATLAIPAGILLLKKGKVDEAANLVKKGADDIANDAAAAAKGAADKLDNVAGNTHVAGASQAVIDTSPLNIAKQNNNVAEAFDEKTGTFVKDVNLDLKP
jgi:hypothetical protein